MFLDVIGTCHSELQKPAVLRPKHLTTYRLHRRRGLTLYPPDQLSAMLQNRSLRLDHQGALCLLDEVPQGWVGMGVGHEELNVANLLIS